MINSNELRIGSLVIYSGGQKDVFAPINAQDIFVATKSKSSEMYSPIPLTEEWLLKSGFEKDKTGDWFTKSDLILGYINSDEYYQFEYTSPVMKWKIIDVKYVHTLQNLYFALTGEELIIN